MQNTKERDDESMMGLYKRPFINEECLIKTATIEQTHIYERLSNYLQVTADCLCKRL